MRILLLALVALIPQPALSQASSANSKPDIVRLAFSWPANVRARVDARRYRERNNGGKHDTSDASMSYRMTAARSGEEYVIRYDDFRYDDFQVHGGGAIPRDIAIVGRLSEFMPTYRVRASGEFSRVESPATIRPFLDSIVTAWTSKDGPRQDVKELIAMMTSDAMLEARAVEEWNVLVGTWIGAQFEIGKVYTTEGEAPLPIFGNAMVKYQYEFSALRRLPCDSVATPTARDCVELQMVSRPDSAAMRDLTQRIVREVMADSAQIDFTEFNLENLVILVTRPETLLPVHMAITKLVTGSARAEGESGTLEQVDVKIQTYTYEKKK